MKRPFALLLLAGALALAPVTGRSATLEDTIRSNYAQMKTFSAEFDQTLTHKESGSVEKRHGKLLFQKPLRIRWQTQKPHEELLIVTDSDIWNYLPDEKIAYRYQTAIIKGSSSIIQVITGQAVLTKDFDVKLAGLENGMQKLLLYPKEPSTQLVEAQIWVEPGTGYIRRGRSVDFYGNTNEISFTKFSPNAELRDGDLRFTPPKGTEVEDRRKDMEKALFN